MFKEIGDIIKGEKKESEDEDLFRYIDYGKVDHVQGVMNTGHWTPVEHELFLEALH